MALSATILGASGYAGGELLRLLSEHPAMTVIASGANTQAGTTIRTVHPHLTTGSSSFLDVRAAASTPADICFSSMPSGALAGLVDLIDAPVVIDLSDEHRDSWNWTYGLTEHVRAQLVDARRIANPGCYPTAALLGLVPIVREGLVGGPVVIDAMSGVSGAGKGLGDGMSFSALHGNAGAYGSTTHRHVAEIERGLALFGGAELTVSFTPHLVPMARGLLVTARAPLSVPIDDAGILAILRDEYDDEVFVAVTPEWPTTKSVLGTNRAVVSARVDERAGMAIVSIAIDNLGKGAAGQSIQNANLVLGLDESLGLQQMAVWP